MPSPPPYARRPAGPQRPTSSLSSARASLYLFFSTTFRKIRSSSRSAQEPLAAQHEPVISEEADEEYEARCGGLPIYSLFAGPPPPFQLSSAPSPPLSPPAIPSNALCDAAVNGYREEIWLAYRDWTGPPLSPSVFGTAARALARAVKGREPTWSNALTRALNEACTVEEWQGLSIADRQDEAIYLGSVAATEEERAAALERIQNRSQHGIVLYKLYLHYVHFEAKNGIEYRDMWRRLEPFDEYEMPTKRERDQRQDALKRRERWMADQQSTSLMLMLV